MSKLFRKYVIFLFVPGIVLGYSFFLKIAAGPYWLAPNFDPSYQYLVNGLYLVKGIVPNHTDHPGTPLQLLCCAVCWLFNIGRPVGDVVTRVLMAPEFYLHAVFVILSLFSFVTSFGLAVYVFRKTGDSLAAVLTQLPGLSFLVLKSWETVEPVFPVVANVFPESLLIGILNLFNICLLMNYFARTPRDTSVTTLFWGFVCGLGVAAKVTFIPLLLVPMIVLSWKNRVLFVGAFVASFVVWTLPILSKYPAVWKWISGIITHTGSYGAGGAGIVEISSYGLNWKNIIIQQGVFVSIVFAALALIIGKLAQKKWDRGDFFLLATTIGVLFQFSVVAKHPGAHYLLPGLGLFSVLLVLFYLQSAVHHVLGRRIAFIFILIGVLIGAWQANGYRLKLEGLTKDIIAFHDQVSTKYQNCTFIDYYRSSDQQAALFFGDGWNLSPRLGGELFRLFPDKYYFNIWGNRITSFNDKVWSNDLLAQNPCVLFRGDGALDFSNSPYDVRLLEKGRFESIHILTGTTEKQAAILLAGAMQFFQAGEYDKAMACALQARRFHYQPDSSVESVIKLFESYHQHQ